MRATRRNLGLAMLILATLGLLAAKAPFDIADTEWQFTSVTSKYAAKAKKLGKEKNAGFETIRVELKGDGQFSAELGGENLVGSWSRKSDASKVVLLDLDAASREAVASRYETSIETSLAGQGVAIDMDLQLVTQVLRLKLKRSKKDNSAVARLKARFKLVGTASGEGITQAPTKVKGLLKGTSMKVNLP